MNLACQQTIQGSPAYSLCQRLKTTKQALRRWNREVFGNIQERIEQLQCDLDAVQQAQANPLVLAKERELIIRLMEKHRKEEELWRQRVQITWMKTPDLNTRFFHLFTIVRRQHSIEALQDE